MATAFCPEAEASVQTINLSHLAGQTKAGQISISFSHAST
jgi:hypothetical protein